MNKRRAYFYHVICERFTNGPIPETVAIRTYHNEKNAQSVFLAMCHDLCYPWETVMEGNSDYLLIAEAGGLGCDYRIMLTAHPKYNDKSLCSIF